MPSLVGSQMCIRDSIPGCVTSRFKCRPNTATRETGRIRLALNKLFTGESLHNFANPGRIGERVVFLGSNTGHRLEPMGKMSRSFFQCPFLHGVSHDICRCTVSYTHLRA